MPIYEYRCSACGHELEALQKFSDAPLTECPSCRKADLVKQVSAAGFHLKGSGWYATDFKSAGAKPTPAKPAGDAKADAKSETAADAKTESKTETKSDAAPACGSGACSSCS